MNKLGDLKTRFFVSAALIAAVLLLIIFSDLMIMRGLVAFAACVLASAGIYEYVYIVKEKKINVSAPLLIGAVVGEILSFFIYSQYPRLIMLPVLAALLFFVILFVFHFKEIEKAIVKISVSVLGFFYVAVPFGMLLCVLYMRTSEIQDGRFWVLYLIFVTKLTDIGAYFGGRLFGKRKLAPALSPKKTVFGAVSGIVFALLGSFLFLTFSKENAFDLNMIEAIMLGLILGVGAQFGDLCESLLKRDAKVKDSSKFPGIGGVLDMMDSLMFNIPILFVYLAG